jgi:hypothetical protein
MKPWDTNLQEVIDFIKSAAVRHKYEEDGNTLKSGVVAWSWVKNWNKEYISLRIDMRDGAFVLQDRDGNRITLDELKHQNEYKDG